MPNRIEREIEEILTKLDEFVPNERPTRRAKRRARGLLDGGGQRLRNLTRGLSGGHVLLGAAVLLLIAFVIRGSFPTIAQWATYIALAVFFGAIVFSIRPIGRKRPTYWRGQPVELRRRRAHPLRGPRPSALMRLRMWWRRRNQSP